MTIPENTSQRDHLTHLMGMLAGGSSDYITGMEADGQKQLVNSTMLPGDMHGEREKFEALGFVFGEQQDIFIDTQLPQGWSKQGSDHSMWSHVVDERGFKRVAIFYKAAFYDRSASMSIQNVGSNLASDALYADTLPEIPWGKLTSEEQAEFTKRLVQMDEDIAEYPDIYGEHAARVAQIRAGI